LIAAPTAAGTEYALQDQRATYAERVQPGSRKGGIVWHTQGSGKSMSMVCFAAKLMQQKAMQNPTLVVVTDRNDLDGQLFQTFVGARSLLQARRRSRPKTATNCGRCWQVVLRGASSSRRCRSSLPPMRKSGFRS
jgi:type I site-specific restriction-modification system R (restriction) subunit